MSALLLSVHVVLAVLSVGPVTVAASLFPPAVRAAWAAAPQQVMVGALAQPPDKAEQPPVATGRDQAGGRQVVRLLHRITRTYAAVGSAVPVFGLATAASLGVLTDAWVLVAVALTAVAAAVLVGQVLPLQQRLLASTPNAPAADGRGQVRAVQTVLTTRLAMATVAFNLLWVLVAVLMVWRPGTTTGV